LWNCHEKTPIESFWRVLENELAHPRISNGQGVIQSIAEYIEIWKRQLKHAQSGYLFLVAFKRQFSRKKRLWHESVAARR
jgi:hypothetical protein